MEILKETPENYIKMDIEFNSIEENMLIDYARNHILDDKIELINYAFVQILKNQINTLKSNINLLKETKKKDEKFSIKSVEKNTKDLGRYRPTNKNRKK
jgi:GH18 family chitinase